MASGRWPDGPRLFEHLRDLPGPLRLDDLPGYVRALGYSADLMRSQAFQGTPMRHRGEQVGHFFLAGKEGGPFTGEDEEVLVLFASQAATAIANARTHRAEQRARADLETLVETSPVGVVVFDARTGQPVSFNREAKRIVEGLRTPGRPAEQLLEVLTCRFADGREVALNQFPLAQTLSSARTMRAEEIVLSVPDGRSVATLVNATPIHAEDGTVESVVVTLQDLAPLEELERLRAEFLGMVSHELRAPLTSIKGSAATALGAAPPPAPAEMLQFFRIIDEQADHMHGLIADLLDAGRIEAGTLTVAPEPSDVAGLVDQARNTFLSGGGRHTVRIDLPPDLPRVLADRQRIVQVLNSSPTRPGTLRSRPPSGSLRSAPACTSRSRSPTKAAAWRRNCCRICSANTPASLATSASVGRGAPAWAWRSARGWWRPTAGAYGPRVAAPVRARALPSRCRWPKRPAAPLSPCPGGVRTRPRTGAGRRASWWWTTTRRRCATFATRS